MKPGPGPIARPPFAEKLTKDLGDNGQSESPPQLTDEQLLELDKTELERYHLRDRPLPAPMAEEAFHGIAGVVVRIIEPESEASREAILAQLLVSIGNRIGRGPHRKQSGVHHLNEFAVLVGETATGRKGTSWVAVQNLLSATDEDWLTTRIRDGFQSGEAIIHAVRDAQYGTTPVNKRKAGAADKAEEIILDAGVTDKRLLIVEEEFGRLLTVATRAGNTLSVTLRKAWDGKEKLYTEGKLSPEKATGSHISMIGHITATELLECIRELENKNGFSNRVLWVASRRVKELPLPGWINWMDHPDVTDHLARVMEDFGPQAEPRELEWSKEAKKEWCEFYKSIPRKGGGIVGDIVARGDPHVLRISMIFAVLDRSALITVEHLRAAIAFWKYCERSAAWVFGEKTGNKDADKIYWELLRDPKGMTRTEISLEVFNNHAPKNRINFALSALVDAGLVKLKHERVPGSDKPVERWFAQRQ